MSSLDFTSETKSLTRIHFKIVTIFPGILSSFFTKGIISQALKSEILKLTEIDLRDFADNKHRKTDDKQYGGGPGMVMKVEPIYNFLLNLLGEKELKRKMKLGKKTLSKLSRKNPLIISTTAKGKKFTQKIAQKLSEFDEIVILCGRYQGFDQRILDNLTDLDLQVGDSIVTGGEILAGTIIESVGRLVPEVLGNENSLTDETFTNGSYPIYTMPREFEGMEVPEVLFSGHHKKVQDFQQEKSKKK